MIARALIALAAAAALPACLELGAGPEQAPPQCEVTSDCEVAAGEVCEEGVCWGDPPEAQLAAIVTPPADRYDLAPTELASISIRDNGWMNDLLLEPPASLRGRVEIACGQCPGGLAIGATIQVRRASSIPGGPEYLASTVATAAASDVSFALAVPALGPDDPPYVLTIVPSDDVAVTPGGLTAAQLVPPLRLVLGPDDLDDDLIEVLEAKDLRPISGRVVDAIGLGIAGMRVSALGRFDPLRPLERVSTIAVTSADGYFDLVLGKDALDVIDIVAVPPAGTLMPTLIAHDRGAFESTLAALTMPSFPTPTRITVPVSASDPSGGSVPVIGARVQLQTVLLDPINPNANVDAVFTVDTYTDALGNIEADVIPGAQVASRSYAVQVTPPANTPAASSWDSTISVGSGGGVVGSIHLAARTTITGVILDHTGWPVEGMTVAAKPSLAFSWSLDEASQRLLAELPAPSALTQPDGSFVMFVDPQIAQAPATYDLVCSPAALSLAPRWTIGAVDGSQGATDVGAVFLPEPANVRGQVMDPDGVVLPGATVRIFALGHLTLCAGAEAPADCVPPAVFLGTGQSDAEGIVRLVLPHAW